MKDTLRDTVVTLFGLATAAITAAILAWIELQFHFAAYAFTFWFVIPIGAILSGMVASSGYIFGTNLLRHRLPRSFSLNMIGVSVATWFLLNWFVYQGMSIKGQHVRDVLTFAGYLNAVIQNRRLVFLPFFDLGKPGPFGYLLVAIQIVGFAAGGLGIYRKTTARLYCDACKRYLVLTDSHVGHGDLAGVGRIYQDVRELLKQNAYVRALEVVRGLPSKPEQDYRLALHFWVCPSCSSATYNLGMSLRDGKKWEPHPDFQARGPLSIPASPSVHNPASDGNLGQVSPGRLAGSVAATAIPVAALVVLLSFGRASNSAHQLADGMRFLSGQGVSRDYGRAFKDFQTAATGGNTLAMVGLAAMYSDGNGVAKDPQQAFAWLRKAADLGHPEAMFQVGFRYANGVGVPRDFALAAHWYEKAAAAGKPEAMNNIGLLYAQGQGVRADPSTARAWFQRAAAAGNVMARNNIGWLSLRQNPPDYAMAAASFETAARAGYVPSMKSLGILYSQGKGVPRSYVKALQWLNQAATAGDTDAMVSLAGLLVDPKAGSADTAHAREWLERAAKARNPIASRALAALRAPVTHVSSKSSQPNQ